MKEVQDYEFSYLDIEKATDGKHIIVIKGDIDVEIIHALKQKLDTLGAKKNTIIIGLNEDSDIQLIGTDEEKINQLLKYAKKENN